MAEVVVVEVAVACVDCGRESAEMTYLFVEAEPEKNWFLCGDCLAVLHEHEGAPVE